MSEKDVAARIGETLRRPDAQYVRDVTGFAIGGIPPLGHDQPLATYLDEALLGYDDRLGRRRYARCRIPRRPRRPRQGHRRNHHFRDRLSG